MGLKKTENQVQILLKDTIVALCRNTLNYHAEISIEGLLCITLDSEDVVLVNINQIIKNREIPKKVKKKKRKRQSDYNSSSEDEIFTAVLPKVMHQSSTAAATSSVNYDSNKTSTASSINKPAVVTVLNEQCAKSTCSNTSSSDQGDIEEKYIQNSPRFTSQFVHKKQNTHLNHLNHLNHNSGIAYENYEESELKLDLINKSSNGMNCIIKAEPPDVIIVKEENNGEMMLPPSDISDNHHIYHTPHSSYTHNEMGHSSNSSLSAEYVSPQVQGHISEDVLTNFNQNVHQWGSEPSDCNTPFSGTSPTTVPTTHICALCGKSFAWQWLLKRHQVVHSGGKGYACEHCQRPFSYQSSVKRHQAGCSARLEILNSIRSNTISTSNSYPHTPPGVSQIAVTAPDGSLHQVQLEYSHNRHRQKFKHYESESPS